jgi:hypothetical protein
LSLQDEKSVMPKRPRLLTPARTASIRGSTGSQACHGTEFANLRNLVEKGSLLVRERGEELR